MIVLIINDYLHDYDYFDSLARYLCTGDGHTD